MAASVSSLCLNQVIAFVVGHLVPNFDYKLIFLFFWEWHMFVRFYFTFLCFDSL